MAIAIDTLAYARKLREAGFSARQAEGQADALAAAMTDTLATKQDLSELETRMQAGFAAVKHDVRELETRMDARLRELALHMEAGFAAAKRDAQELEIRTDARFADLERRMTLRLGTMMVAAIGAASALAKLLL
jgi:hypothetical protein